MIFRKQNIFRIIQLLVLVFFIFTNMPKVLACVPLSEKQCNVDEALVNSKQITDSISVDSLLNTQPQFVGGEEAMELFIKNKLRYPKKALKVRAEGRVVLRLTIDEAGEIAQIAILRGLYPPCDEEAIYVVRSMPKWIPGKRDGKNVAMQTIVPIPFDVPKGM